jgi:predicted kinase
MTDVGNPNLKLIIFRGPPASGKSTTADKFRPSMVIVNRDSIRFSLYGRYFGGNINEDVVTDVENTAIASALSAGQSVLLDSTNLRNKNLNTKLSLAALHGATVEFVDFEVPLDQAIAWDTARGVEFGRAVGERVIRSFYKRYKINPDTGKLRPAPTPLPEFEPYVKSEYPRPYAYIVDTDGTVADHEGVRNPYDTTKYHLDKYRDHVANIVSALGVEGYSIIALSGRDEEFRDVTEKWWRDGDIPFDEFHMRPPGDKRMDAIIKYELFKEYIEPRFDVLGAFDDRPQVIRMWRKIGVPVIDVGFGKEF